MNNNEYVRLSLELHLFFDRIMKEHSLFLETAFMEKNKNLKQVARNFQEYFSDNLKKIVYLADGNISNEILLSNEIVTKDTLEAEMKTSKLTGVNIDSEITKKEVNLRSGKINNYDSIMHNISTINKETLPMIQKLIKFKSDVLNNVLSCNLYTINYPNLFSHIINEAKMYYLLLNKIENKTLCTKKELYEQEIFWNNIMKEHAEFIRGLLDPSQQELILTADKYANEYKMIIDNYSNNSSLTSISLQETIYFREFKIAGEEGILNCKIKSIISPLLADHVLREANHFLRLLNKFENHLNY